MTSYSESFSDTVLTSEQLGSGGLKVTIAGINVTSYVRKAQCVDTIGFTVAELDLELALGVQDVVTLASGQTVQCFYSWSGVSPAENSDRIFKGRIETFSLEGAIIKVVCYNELKKLSDSPVNKVYTSADATSGKPSEIFKDLVTNNGTYNLNADATSVQDSGSVIILEKFICRDTNAYEAMKRLAEDVLGWQFYYRADTDKFYFEPKGYSTNSVTLTTGTQIIAVPVWYTDKTDMVNRLTIKGARQLVEAPPEYFNGTGASATYTLSHQPDSLLVSENVAGTWVDKTGGLVGATGTYDYTLDKTNKTFTYTAAVGVSNVRAIFVYAIYIPVVADDQNSIDSFGGVRPATITFTDVVSVSDARARASAIINSQKNPFNYTTLKVRNVQTAGLRVGQKITVVDSWNSLTLTVTINRLVFNYPNSFIELSVGDKEWRLSDYYTTQDTRLKRLEETDAQDTDLVQNLKRFSHTQEVKRKTLNVYTRDIGKTFIYDNDTNGVYDSTGAADQFMYDDQGSAKVLYYTKAY